MYYGIVNWDYPDIKGERVNRVTASARGTGLDETRHELHLESTKNNNIGVETFKKMSDGEAWTIYTHDSLTGKTYFCRLSDENIKAVCDKITSRGKAYSVQNGIPQWGNTNGENKNSVELPDWQEVHV